MNYESYLNRKNDRKEIACDSCGFSWLYKATDVRTANLTAKEMNITLTYFTCPKCGKVYKVDIDTQETLKLKQQLELRLHNLQKATTKGQNTERSIAKVKSIQNRLVVLHNELNTTFNGEFTSIS